MFLEIMFMYYMGVLLIIKLTDKIGKPCQCVLRSSRAVTVIG